MVLVLIGLVCAASLSAQGTRKPQGAANAARESSSDEPDAGTAVTVLANVGLDAPAAAIQAPIYMQVPATGGQGAASAYPAQVQVQGFNGTIGHLEVRLNGVTHTDVGDLDVLLVGPTGQFITLMSDVANGVEVNGVNLRFSDEGIPLLEEEPGLPSGTYAPSDVGMGVDNFPAPAPDPGAAVPSPLSIFNGTNPNGTWQLYVVDDAARDTGSISGFTLFISPQFSNTGDSAIPDNSSAETPVIVSGITTAISKVNVSMHLSHTRDSDLDVSLVGPDGTIVPLSTGNGGTGDNYGTNCNPGGRTRFDDGAATAITAGAAPFAALFKPEGTLATFTGKSGNAANGQWKLRMADTVAGMTGTFHCWSLFLRQADDTTTLEAPMDLHAFAVVGNQVTLRWAPPPGGLSPTGYVMEGGITPGQTLATIPTFGAYPAFNFTAPSGTFFVRVRATNGALLGPPSNEIPLYVDVPVAPSRPEGFQSYVAIANLGLAWRNTFRGGAPTSFILDVTQSPLGAASIPLSAVDTFFVAGIPAGQYRANLRAVNAGGASPPSDTLTWAVESDCGLDAPSTPIDFLAYKSGSTLYLVWTPANEKAASDYIVYATGAVNAAVPVNGRSISAQVPPGTYTFAVAAKNQCGVSAPTPGQAITIP